MGGTTDETTRNERASAEPAGAVARLDAWRERSLTLLARALFLFQLPTFTWWIAMGGEHRVRIVVVLVGVQALVGLCAFSQVHYRWRARSLLLAYSVGVVTITAALGPTPGAAAVVGLVSVLGVLLLGAREGILHWAIVVGGMAACTALVAAGLLPPPTTELSDPRITRNATRMTFAVVSYTPTFVLACAYVTQRLSGAFLEAERLVGELRVQMDAREAAEKRRLEAERALMDAQRLEALGRLAGGVAHDVNNSLTVALLNAALIEDGAPPPDVAKQAAASIREACESATTLTRQLLTLGRRDVSRPELVGPSALLQRVQRIVHPAIEGKVALRIDCPPKPPALFVDPSQLEQVILHFILNARDSMPDGGEVAVRLDVGASPAYDFASSPMEPEHPVRIHVEDAGAGHDAETLPRLFEPFFATRERSKGAGLGLALARTFAESNGGRVAVRSRVGQGTIFTLELPGHAEAATAESAKAKAPEPLPPATILVADDEVPLRIAVAKLLRSDGHTVLEASDVPQALDAAERHGTPVDLLVSDAMMPGGGGEALVVAFRARYPTSRILVCSGYVDQPALRQWLREGAYPSLAKPFTPQGLRQAVRAVLTSVPAQ